MPNSYSSWRTGVQIDNIYPVGSIYMSINSTNPRSLFGGTWEQIQDKFLLCCGTTYAAGSTGGAATMAHTHSQVAVTTGASSAANSGGPSNNTSGSTAITVAQMPSHVHKFQRQQWYSADTVSNSSTGTIYSWKSGAGTGGATSQGFIAPDSLYGPTGGGGGHTHTLSSHTHTIAHTHSISATTTGAASNTNNMPPYLAVYVFKRTA